MCQLLFLTRLASIRGSFRTFQYYSVPVLKKTWSGGIVNVFDFARLVSLLARRTSVPRLHELIDRAIGGDVGG